MRKVIIGGTFDEQGGKSSYIVSGLSTALGNEWESINGGDIQFIRDFDPTGINVLIWMPNVSNDEIKVIGDLKVKNPRMILIQSKRVIEKEYFPSDVVGRLLKSHALLGIMITKEDGKYRYRLLLIFGNEHRGIGDNIFALRDKLPRSMVFSIPMKGVLRSLNVSASVAMVGWDMVSELFNLEC